VVKDPAEGLCCGEGVPLEVVLMQGVQHPDVVGLKTFMSSDITPRYE